MELELGLAPPNAQHPSPAVFSGGCGEFVVGLLGGGAGRKRVICEAFGGDEKAAATLPLFVRDGDGDGGGDGDGARDGVGDRETSNKRRRLVGWPPVKCAHRRRCGSGYVKVKMEGVAIGRKVDVSLHASYDELLRTLARMFPPAANDDDDDGAEEEEEERRGGHGHHHHPYVVTYEDGDGDWLLVGDVPWETFAKSVKRLKIIA